MSENIQAGHSPQAVEQVLQQELAHGDVIIATARPILRHLLANNEHVLFSDEVIATVRGMMLNLARQLLFAAGRAEGGNNPAAFADERQDHLASAFLEQGEFLSHAHALTIEAQVAQRLSQRSGIDPVLSPLLQELVAASEDDMAGNAMHVLAAQARFIQQQRRMELPLSELPADLHNQALQLFIEHSSVDASRAKSVAESLRGEYDPETRRVGQIVRLISAMQYKAKRALEVDNAGLSIFVTALGMASDQDRETIILSLGENQCARLAMSLRAAGLGQPAVEEQFLYLHPEISLPEGFDTVRSDRAFAMLAHSQPEQMS